MKVALDTIAITITGAAQGFQVRGNALKIMVPSGARHENIWGISFEKSRFYSKKSFFFPKSVMDDSTNVKCLKIHFCGF